SAAPTGHLPSAGPRWAVWADVAANRSQVGLPPIDVVIAGKATRRQKYHQKQRCGGEADDDGGEYKGLRYRVGVQGRIDVPRLVDYSGRADAQAPHRKNEQVDRVGQK